MLDLVERCEMSVTYQMGRSAQGEELERQARKRSNRRVLHGGICKPRVPKASVCLGRERERCGSGFVGPPPSLLGHRNAWSTCDHEGASARGNRALAEVVAASTLPHDRARHEGHSAARSRDDRARRTPVLVVRCGIGPAGRQGRYIAERRWTRPWSEAVRLGFRASRRLRARGLGRHDGLRWRGKWLDRRRRDDRHRGRRGRSARGRDGLDRRRLGIRSGRRRHEDHVGRLRRRFLASCVNHRGTRDGAEQRATKRIDRHRTSRVGARRRGS
jgi:hypothetical protein